MWNSTLTELHFTRLSVAICSYVRSGIASLIAAVRPRTVAIYLPFRKLTCAGGEIFFFVLIIFSLESFAIVTYTK